MDFCVDSAEAIRSDDVASLGYTGEGVKIGQIELGVPDRSQDYFEGATIHYDPAIVPENYYDDHATRVACVMVSQDEDYPGLAKDAELYCTIMGNSQDYAIERIEWLLDQGVQVINMSAGYVDHLSTYTSFDNWIDEIAIRYSVHFVAAKCNFALSWW